VHGAEPLGHVLLVEHLDASEMAVQGFVEAFEKYDYTVFSAFAVSHGARTSIEGQCYVNRDSAGKSALKIQLPVCYLERRRTISLKEASPLRRGASGDLRATCSRILRSRWQAEK
jgi:hypothetical protein